MGTGQMLLTIGAVILLGSIIATTDNGINSSGQVLMSTSMGLEEVSLASTIIQRAEALDFDEKSKDSVQINSPTQLTAVNSLGYENNDSTDLDDVDDYNGKPGVNNGYRQEIDTLATGIYYARTQVHYVSLSNLNANAAIQTYHKKLDISIWNKDQADPKTGKPDTLKMSTIISYWAF